MCCVAAQHLANTHLDIFVPSNGMLNNGTYSLLSLVNLLNASLFDNVSYQQCYKCIHSVFRCL